MGLSRDDGGMMGRRRLRDACAVDSVAALALAARCSGGLVELVGGRGRDGGRRGGGGAGDGLRAARHDTTSPTHAVERRRHTATADTDLQTRPATRHHHHHHEHKSAFV